MTQAENQMNSVLITYNPRLQELLENGKLDWDNHHHRIAVLRAWVNRPIKQKEESLDG